MSKITVTTIAGATSGADANKVKIESGDELNVVNGDLTVNTDTLFVDASADKVGIGTTTVDRQLHIEANNSSAYSSTDFDQTYNLLKIENNNTTNNVATGLQFLVGTNGSASISTTRTGDGEASLCFGTRGGGSRKERMRIDSRGRITMPEQPAFFATAEANISLSNSYAELTSFSNAQVNIGTHYNTSNGRFTAPVAGTYQFAVASIGNNAADVYRFRPYKNGSSLNNYELRIHTEGSAYGTNGEFCFYVTLAVNDYISIFGYSDGSNNAYGATSFRYSYFRGHLMN